MAMMVEAKTIRGCVYGATDPARTGPHGFAELAIKGRAPCSPCYRKHCAIGRQCMRSITSAAIGALTGAVHDASGPLHERGHIVALRHVHVQPSHERLRDRAVPPALVPQLRLQHHRQQLPGLLLRI